MEAFDHVTPENWQACINHVIKEENDFIENDKFLDELDENGDNEWEDVNDEGMNADDTVWKNEKFTLIIFYYLDFT